VSLADDQWTALDHAVMDTAALGIVGEEVSLTRTENDLDRPGDMQFVPPRTATCAPS